jgi:hypothetical protein
MEKQYLYAYFGILAFVLFLGTMFMFGMMGSSKYYQQQYYNTLPSLQTQQQNSVQDKPQAIQHYEQMRDGSVRTEESNPVPTNINVNIENSSNVNVTIDLSTKIVNNLYPMKKDGSINIAWIVIFIAAFYSFYTINIFGYDFSTRRKIFPSLLLAFVFTVIALVFTSIGA